MRRAALLLLLALLALPAGASAGERVVGGRTAQAGEAPWQVALVRSGQPAFAGQFCGGSLVDATHVVTAAHCVTDDDGATVATSSFTVLAGVTRLAPDGDAGGQTRAVRAVARMLTYAARTFTDDAAVVTLDAPLALQDGVVAPLALATTRVTGGDLRVSGWGDTTAHERDADGVPGTYPLDLQVADVPFVDDATCAAELGPALDLDATLCAGGTGTDACYGDSGGPLTQGGVLAGIVSSGEGCASSSGSAGLYTEVADPGIGDFLRGAVAATPPDGAPAPVPTVPAPAPAPVVVVPAPVLVAPTPAPAPAPAAAPAPRAAVVVAASSGAVSATGAVRVRLRADADARVALRLTDGDGRRLAATTVTLRAGVRRVVTLRLGVGARRRTTARALRARLRITGTAAGVVGPTRTVALRLRSRA